MAESSPSSSPSIPSSSSSSTGSVGQSLRWSLQNFPVPVQLQPRIPRSPLSVAQELLPNFPSQLMENETPPAEERPHQYYMSLQQQMQQQLQQQFQRQLQLNLQGGGESHGISIPDPPDTTLDIDLPGATRPSGSLSRPPTSGSSSDSTTQWTGLRGALNSANLGLLEALFSNSNTHSNNTDHRRSATSESGVVSRQTASSSSASNSHSHAHSHNQGHRHSGHHHHHHHNLSDEHSVMQTADREGSGDGEGGPLHANPAVGGPPVSSEGGNGNHGNSQPGTIQNSAELSLLYKWLTESGIFVILLLLHFLYDHRLGLLVFLCTGGTFYYTNMKLVHSIHLSAVRDSTRSWSGFLNLAWLAGFLLANIIILYYVFADQQLWRLLYYQMAAIHTINVWMLLWCVVMTDYIIKFMTVISKALLALLQPCFHNYRQRGKLYLMLESMSQLYRQSVTIVPWLYYLNDSTRTSLWFAFVTEAVYLGFKGWSIWKAVQFLYISFRQFQSNTPFGRKPSSSDLLEKGNQCPICQDSVKEPVMLPCKHIFCEQCVTMWFDREKTCPMCRAQITTESPLWKDGNTSAHLQWH